MKFNCEKCDAEYIIPDEKLGEKGVRVKCKKCDNIIEVRPEKKKIKSSPHVQPVPSFGEIKKAPSYEEIMRAKQQEERVDEDGVPDLGLTAAEDREPIGRVEHSPPPVEEDDIPEPPEEEPPKEDSPFSSSFQDQLDELGNSLPDIAADQEPSPPPFEDDGVDDIPLPSEEPPESGGEDATRVAPSPYRKAGMKAEGKGTNGEDLPLPPPPPRDEFEEQLESALSKLDDVSEEEKARAAQQAREDDEEEGDQAETRIFPAFKDKVPEKGSEAKSESVKKKETEWFVAINDQSTGPIFKDDLETLWKKGDLTPETLIWQSSFTDWIPLAQAKELKFLLSIEQPRGFAMDDDLLPLPETIPEPPPPAEEKKAEKEEFTWKPSAGKALENLVGGALASLDDIEAEDREREAEEASLSRDGKSAVSLLDELDAEEPPEPPEEDEEESEEELPFRKIEEASEELVDDDKTMLRPAPTAPSSPLPPPKAPSVSELPKTAYYEPAVGQALKEQKSGIPVKYIVIGAGGLFMVMFAIIIALLVRTPPEPEAVAQAPVQEPAKTAEVAPPPPPVEADKEEPKEEVAATDKAAEPEPAKEAEKVAEAKPEEKKPERKQVASASPSSGKQRLTAKERAEKRKQEARERRERQAAAKREREAAAPPPPPPKREPAKRGGGGVDDLLAFEGTKDKTESERLISAIRTEDKAPPPKKKQAEPPPPPPPSQKKSLTKKEVQAVIQKNYGQIQACAVEQRRRDSSVQGTMRVKWLVQPNGSTKDAQVVDQPFMRSFFGSCVTQAVSRWKFPSFDGNPMPITYPFKLQ